MEERRWCAAGCRRLLASVAVVAALALLMAPALVSGAPQGQDPAVPTPEGESRVESPFRSNIVPPSGAAGGAQVGFSPQGGQVAGQFDFTPWILICCFALVVLAVIWAALFWLLGRRKDKNASQPPPAELVPEPPATLEPPAIPATPPQPSPPPTAIEAVPSGASLTMQKGPQPGWRYDITESPVSIGSESESDMVVSDPQVSPRHAMIWREREYFYIQEVSTEFGTFVNGERLTKARLLRDGDEIGLGPVVVLVFKSTG
jgi:hypothetical protein